MGGGVNAVGGPGNSGVGGVQEGIEVREVGSVRGNHRVDGDTFFWVGLPVVGVLEVTVWNL